MQTIIENLTLPKRGWFGIVFGRQPAIEQFLETARADHRALLTIGVDGMPVDIEREKARKALEDGQTVYKMYHAGAEFSVPLRYEKLELSDGHTLDLDFVVDLRMSKPIRFLYRYQAGMSGGKLTDEQLSCVWSRTFHAAILGLTQTISAPVFCDRLTDRAVLGAIQPVYKESSLDDTVGVDLIGVRNVNAYSLSYAKQLKQEIEQTQREAEQKAKEEERQKLRAIQQVKEIELQQLKERRFLQEQETAARLEQQRLDKEEKDRLNREKLRFLVLYKNRWPKLSDPEKILAGQMSDFFREQAQARPIQTVLPAARRTELQIDDTPAQLNVLAKGSSLAFTITVPQDGVVTILNLGTSGRITVLIPNSMTGADGAAVRVIKGQTLKFPQSFLPSIAPDIFEEQSDSGLEGIYCLITPEPLIPIVCTGQLNDLPTLDYSRVPPLLELLESYPQDAWSIAALEFEITQP